MNHPLEINLTSAELSAVNQPISQASGIPNSAYTDKSLFEFERDHLFATNWAAIAFVDQLSSNGVRPMDFMGLPLLITKSREQQVRVFHNVCSHRGMKLVDEERTTNGLIVCPYHSWTYAVNGDLKATPHIGGVGKNKIEGFTCANKGLKEIRSHIWMGILFINLSGDADAFEQNARSAIERAQGFMGESGEGYLQAPYSHGNLAIELNCNWKLAIENYLEAYHLPFIHPGLNSYSPLSAHHCEIYADKHAGQYTTTFDPRLDSEDPLPLFPDWDPERLQTGDYPALFPNLLLGFQANHVFAMIIHPRTVDTSYEELAIFYVGEEGANDPRYEQARQENLQAWTTVFNEDIGPCERMQIGRQSPGYTGGAFSPELDICSHHFHKWVAAEYQKVIEGY